MYQVRTCVGCRQQGNRADLVRIIQIQGSPRFDLTKSTPGRGCWIHPKNSCFAAAIEGPSLSRALRVRVNLQDLADLKEQAEKMIEN
ncbi:MAG: DUF448 domain-containing protein [Acidobacteria bacterium]|nr:DUF448 domain-containing protein [Acidobacteriota bacterium]NDC47996.1 YlxR family protein [Micrococcales bacterium]